MLGKAVRDGFVQLPYPFPGQMGWADHDVEGFPIGAVCPLLAVLVGIQGGCADLALAGAAFGHQERQPVGFQLPTLEGLRRTKLCVEQRVSGVCEDIPIDLLHRRRHRLLGRVEPGREAVLDPPGDFVAELPQVGGKGRDMPEYILLAWGTPRNGDATRPSGRLPAPGRFRFRLPIRSYASTGISGPDSTPSGGSANRAFSVPIGNTPGTPAKGERKAYGPARQTAPSLLVQKIYRFRFRLTVSFSLLGSSSSCPTARDCRESS